MLIKYQYYQIAYKCWEIKIFNIIYLIKYSAYVDQLEENNRAELAQLNNNVETVEDDDELDELDEDEDIHEEKPEASTKPIISIDFEKISKFTIDQLLGLFAMCRYNTEALKLTNVNNFFSGNEAEISTNTLKSLLGIMQFNKI